MFSGKKTGKCFSELNI